ncbi:MAG: DinB family protein [Pirellulaceae bacterium]|nr:DinB family protein [Pirellulaceae bacterium]
MSREDDGIQSSLAPPGAGLPVVQAFVLRHLIFPAYCLTTSWDKALAAFQAEGLRMISLVERLTDEQLQRRVLVKAPLGIEDSSRYWSAAMVLEHLIEVGSRVAVGIIELTHGTQVTIKADIADVKPKGGQGPQIIEDYRQFLEDYTRMIDEEAGDRASRSRHLHPWFGELNAHQWNCLGAVHQSVHRKQLERIIAGLDGPPAAGNSG